MDEKVKRWIKIRVERNGPVNNTNRLQALEIFIIIILSVIIFYPPYLQGLFFEKDQIPTQIFVFTLFTIFLVFKWLKKDFRFLRSPIEFIAVGFVIVYLLSTFTAVHIRSAITEVLKYCMYFTVFYMVSDLAKNLKTRLLFLWIIVISGVGVSIIGLDSAMGGSIVSVLNNLFNKIGMKGNLFFGLFVNGRINSTLQYPNALASYMMAVFFIVIGLILSEQRLWMKAIYGVCSYILFLTFMLTESRGAQLLFPLAIIIFIVVAPKNTRIKSGFHVLFIAAPAIGISLFIFPYLSSDKSNQKALILFAAGILTTVLFTIFAESFGNLLQKINWRVYVILIAVLVVVLPLVVLYIINVSIPLELFHGVNEENSSKVVSRNVSLTQGDYILVFEAEVVSEKEQPNIYTVNISAKSEEDIIFNKKTTLASKTFIEALESKRESIKFTVMKDRSLVTIDFINYYSGTGVILNNAEVIDSISGNTIRKVILKNKYNLETFITRFQNITKDKSVMTRLILYKDGLKMFSDRWFLGGGGGAWEYLYRQYQSYNYSSSQAHNYPLQLGIETGIMGLLVLICLIFFLVLGYVRYVKKAQNRKQTDLFINTAVITAIATLLVHAVMDFDFSESAMLLLFWQLIALFNREIRDSQVFEMRIIDKAQKGRYKNNAITGIIIGTVACIIAIGFSISFYLASLNAKEAFRYIQQSNVDEAIDSINRAIRLDKFNEKYVIGYNPTARTDIKAGLVDILFTKADLLQQQLNDGNRAFDTEQQKLQHQFNEMYKLVLRVEEESKNNLTLSANLAGFYFQMGNNEKGIEHLNHTIKLSPFEPSLWHSKVKLYFDLARFFYNQADDESAKKYLAQGVNIIQEAMEVNRRNMDPFMFSEKTVEILQYINFMYDYYERQEMNKINEMVHYTIPNLDINLDKVPDQWKSGDNKLVQMTASEQGIYIHVNDSSYIYIDNIVFEKGKTYLIKVKMDRPVENMTFDIAGLTEMNTVFNAEGDNMYTAEVLINREPTSYGNRLKIYFDSDCVIERILLFKQ